MLEVPLVEAAKLRRDSYSKEAHVSHFLPQVLEWRMSHSQAAQCREAAYRREVITLVDFSRSWRNFSLSKVFDSIPELETSGVARQTNDCAHVK